MPKRSGKVTKKVGRSAVTGRFVSEDFAKRNPKTTIVETIKPSPSGKGKKKK